MPIYPIVFVILLIIILRYTRFFRVQGIDYWVIPTAFLIKFIVGILFNIIHEQTYGHGDLSHDGGRFLLEGKLLNNVFYQNPLHYFQLLTGIGETSALTEKYLYMTKYWSAGDLTIINDSKNVIRVQSVIHFFSNGWMYIHLAIMCLITLIGLNNFYLAFKNHIQIPEKKLYWILLLIPSTIFWTSSILKEPILFFGMSLFVWALLVQSSKLKKSCAFIISLFIMLAFKPYILVCLILALLCYLVYRYIFNYRMVITVISIIVFPVLSGIILIKPKEMVVNYLTRKQFDFVNVGKGGLHVIADSNFYYFQPKQYKNLFISKDFVVLKSPSDAFIVEFGSTKKPIPVHLEPTKEAWKIYYFKDGCASFIETTPIDNSSIQLIKNIPEALANSILRPYPFDPGSNLKYLSIIEVWVMILFIGFAIYNRRKLSLEEKGIIFTLAIFAILLSLLIGWTTPVLGAIARYRFPAQLAIILIGLILLKPKMFTKWTNSSS